MEPRDKQNWENQWGEAFKGASETPSPLVWKSVEASLASGSMPGKAWWAWVAAAFLGGVITTASLFVMMDQSEMNQLALETKTEGNMLSKGSNYISIDRYEPSDIASNKQSSDSQASGNELIAVKRKPNSSSRVSFIDQEEGEGESGASLLGLNENVVTPVIQLSELKPLRPDLLPEESMASVEVKGIFIFDPSKFKPKDNTHSNDWLAGLAISSGAFQQANNGVASSADMNTFGVAPKNIGFIDYSETGISSSMGMSVGKKLNKWIISGGLGYLVTTNQSTSNLMLVSETNKGDRNVVGELSSQGFGFSEPAADGYLLESTEDTYKMQNSYQFVSVPVNVGYYLIDKKWKLNLNAGLNTDIFYQYSSQAETGDLQDYVVKPSDDENWKYLNMSIAGGVEVSRVLANKYLVALAPGYRHALGEFGVTGNNQLQPNVFNVSVRFNYIF